jgi:hypothetical protein
VNVAALAVLVAEISDALAEDLRAERDCLADTAWELSNQIQTLSAELATVRAERDVLVARLSLLNCEGWVTR